MRITKLSLAGALFGLSVIAACRGSDNGGANPDAPPGPTVDAPARIRIQDVQSDAMREGAAVELSGVVVTAVDTFGSRRTAFWVQEPGGGPFSGVQVFVNRQVALLDTLVPGDVVNIKGATKTEFVLRDASGAPQDTSNRTTTELQAPQGGMLTVTKTGTATIPDPQVIDVVAFDGMTQAARDAEYEKWEGVLVQVRNVRSRAYPEGFGSARPIPDDAYAINVTDNLLVESTQTKFTGIDGLTCFASVTGVEDYFFNWLLLPRSATDIVTGTGCAPVTATATDITAIQGALPAGVVELTDVFVTGVSSTRTSVWLSTSLTAAKDQGGFVFQSSTTLPLDAAIVPGVKVNVIGTVIEFNDDAAGGALTEVQPLRITVVDPAPMTPIPLTETVATLLVPENGPPHESVLVTLDNVEITALGSGTNGFIATAKQEGTTFGIGTDIKRLAATDLACYKSVTGFWTNLQAPSTAATTKPNAFGFIVRDLGTKDGTCK